MNLYSQNFTLKDIFNNKKLTKKFPLIKYEDIKQDNGKNTQKAKLQSINTLVFDTAKESGSPYYKSIKATRFGNKVMLNGELVVDENVAFNGIFSALYKLKGLISWTANNGNMIKDALLEGEKNRAKYGTTSKLYLKVQSMQQIEGMNREQLSKVLNEVMENIYYGDDFPKTQKKWEVSNLQVSSSLDYKRRKENWKRKVGAL